MKEHYLSNSEKTFVQKIITEGRRLDGRNYNESRKLNINFGLDYGSCVVSLGDTKVLGQVSCEVTQPKQIRPNEGILHINVDIGPMAAPHFEANRQTDLCVYLNRLLEKCFKDSKCVDLESLCIVVEEKVWSLRVDIRVLNHAGNLIECASIAALASLAHFKRPDVTRSGDNVVIHTLEEKDPIPTVLYHYPVCTTFSVFPNSILISDPSFLEENVCSSRLEENVNTCGSILVIGMNQYREICVLELTGAAITEVNVIHKATLAAASRCKEVVEQIKQTIIVDDNVRQQRSKVCFTDMVQCDNILSHRLDNLEIKLKSFSNNHEMEVDSNEEKSDNDDDFSKYEVVKSKSNTAETVAKKPESTWLEISSESEAD